MSNKETQKKQFKTWMRLICGRVYGGVAGLPDEEFVPECVGRMCR